MARQYHHMHAAVAATSQDDAGHLGCCAQCGRCGKPDHGCAVIGHPIASDAQLADYTRAIVEQARRPLPRR
jgi:hypothetical protein